MIKILVSECLYGGRTVRYDGGEVPETHPAFLKWKEEGGLIPICPEVFGEEDIDEAAAYLDELKKREKKSLGIMTYNTLQMEIS